METTDKISKGIESLKAAVQKDCTEGNNCFNPNGCDKERHKTVPEDNPRLLEMGIKVKCIATTKCMHDYCGKYKWVMDRAKMYADFTGSTVEQVMEAWEKDRSYWYMSYYQECNQPSLDLGNKKVVKYDDWIAQLKERFGDNPQNWRFTCVSCKGTQSINDFLLHGVEKPEEKVYFSCIGRNVEGIGCNWTLGGLFQLHNTVVVKDFNIFPVFDMADAE